MRELNKIWGPLDAQKSKDVSRNLPNTMSRNNLNQSGLLTNKDTLFGDVYGLENHTQL